MASTLWKLFDSDATKGTCKVVSDDAGAATLTVDAVAGDVTGAVAATTLTASGVTGLSGATTLSGVTIVSDSAMYLTNLPVGNDTSAFGIGRIYTDTTSYLKWAKG